MKNFPGASPPTPVFAHFARTSFQPPQYEFRSDGPVKGFVAVKYVEFSAVRQRYEGGKFDRDVSAVLEENP